MPNKDLSSDTELQAISEDDDAASEDNDTAVSCYAASSGGSRITAEEMDQFFEYWFGDEADGFKEQCQDIFARAVFARTEALEEEAEELQDLTIELASRVCELERELVFNEATGNLVLTDKARFRAQVEHLEFDDPDTYKKQLLTEKRRLFPHATGSSDPLHEESPYEPAPLLDPRMKAYMEAISKIARQ